MLVLSARFSGSLNRAEQSSTTNKHVAFLVAIENNIEWIIHVKEDPAWLRTSISRNNRLRKSGVRQSL